jgi:hypothetical protein
MAQHAMPWRPAGAAAAFLLAVVAGVVGKKLTGRITVALSAFVVLPMPGMAAFWLEQHADGQASAEDQGGGQPGGAYDLRGAQGAQVGDGNRQTNYFGHEPGNHE